MRAIDSWQMTCRADLYKCLSHCITPVPSPAERYISITDSHLRFDIWFEVRSQAAQRELSGIPQFVAEMTITLHTKYVKINIPSCRIKYNKESQVSLFSIS